MKVDIEKIFGMFKVNINLFLLNRYVMFVFIMVVVEL